MHDLFRALFAYHHRFNQAYIDLCAAHAQHLPPQAQTLLNHSLNAHEIWNARILGRAASVGVWDIRPWPDLMPADAQNLADSLHILAQTPDLGAPLPYTTSRGEAFANTVCDILMHVCNHTSYHRGQIATALKAAGIPPLSSDYIAYKRS